MKKFILSLVILFMTVFTMNAQNQTNYAGSSKLTDNVSVTLQGGVVTPMSDFFEKETITPIAVLGVDKYINPWLGVALEGRTSVGVGDNYNPHTVFDAVNVSGYAKFNLMNMINFTGERRVFEPVLYTGIGWGHTTCSNSWKRNYMTYRAGAELNINLGKEKAWGIVVNPSVVWGDITNGKLNKRNGHFELTAGLVYHFKTSNGTRTFAKAVLYDQAEVDALMKRITELESRKPEVVTVVKEVPVMPTAAIGVADHATGFNKTSVVTFSKNSAELSADAKAVLDKIPVNAKVAITGSTSPEGTAKRNTVLAQERADAVANYLKARGVTVVSAVGGEAGRAATITIQ